MMMYRDTEPWHCRSTLILITIFRIWSRRRLHAWPDTWVGLRIRRGYAKILTWWNNVCTILVFDVPVSVFRTNLFLEKHFRFALIFRTNVFLNKKLFENIGRKINGNRKKKDKKYFPLKINENEFGFFYHFSKCCGTRGRG